MSISNYFSISVIVNNRNCDLPLGTKSWVGVFGLATLTSIVRSQPLDMDIGPTKLYWVMVGKSMLNGDGSVFGTLFHSLTIADPDDPKSAQEATKNEVPSCRFFSWSVTKWRINVTCCCLRVESVDSSSSLILWILALVLSLEEWCSGIVEWPQHELCTIIWSWATKLRGVSQL